MKKKMIAAVLCTAMCTALCACGTSKQTETPEVTLTASVTVTPQPTVTPSAIDLALAEMPKIDYEDYVASTKLPEGYVGLVIEPITDAEVEAYVQETLENNKERELKDGPIEESDIAIVDYVGYIDNVAFDGGTAYSEELEIGNAGYIDGFEDGLIGVKSGETVILNLKFPEDYRNTEVAGKDVVFEVTVHSVAAQVLPEFTDEFVTELTSGDYTTTEDYRLYARGFLTEERKYTTIMDYVVENATFGEMNEEYIKATVELEKLYYAAIYGFESVEAFEELFGAETSEILWAMVEKEIYRYEQERIALYCVAKAENITLSEEEFTTAATTLASSVSLTLEEFLEVEDETALRQSVMMEKALEYLLDSVVEKGEE